MEHLKNIFVTYEQAQIKALQNAKPFAGWFGIGMGDDPRNDPCHKAFYDGVGEWVTAFVHRNPNEAQAKDAVYFILSAAAESRKKQTYWYCLAVQGHVKQMIGLLGKENCAQLQKWYDQTYPRRERLPVNDELYSMIKKAAK